MLIGIFFAFLGLALVLTIFGFVADISIFTFVGAIMIFLIGLALLNGSLELKTGENTVYTYGNNFSENSIHWDELHQSDYPKLNPSDDPIYLFHTNESIEYDSYDGLATEVYAKLLLFLGILAFCLALFLL